MLNTYGAELPVLVPFNAVVMSAVNSASFRPATEPASFTTTILVCPLELEPELTSCITVGIKAARNTITRRSTLAMMKLRLFTRFLYARPIIKPILRRLFWAAAPELTATAPCCCPATFFSGVSTVFVVMVSFLLSMLRQQMEHLGGNSSPPVQ